MNHLLSLASTLKPAKFALFNPKTRVLPLQRWRPLPDSPRLVNPQPAYCQNPGIFLVLERVVLPQNPNICPSVKSPAHDPTQYLEKRALVSGIHLGTVHHQQPFLIAVDHVVVDLAGVGTGVDVVDFSLGVVQRRADVFHAHVDEPVEIAQELVANESQQRAYVQFHLVLGEFNAEFVENVGKSGVNVADHLSENLVQRLQDELDETALRRIVGRFLGELAPEMQN